MKILITTDSSCDIPKEILKQRGIPYIGINVTLGSNEYTDGENISPNDIFEYVKINKKLPKTAALSEDQYTKFFKDALKQADKIIHIGLGAKISSQYDHSIQAAASFGGKVRVIDSASLSSGVGLLVLAADDMVKAGKNFDEIIEEITARVPSVQASFIIQDVEYLYRGGRCSGMALLGANLLKIKPRIQLVDGKMVPYDKPRGKMEVVLKQYVDKVLAEFNTPDKTRCFIVHTHLEPNIVEEIKEYIRQKNVFTDIIEVIASATITSHAGKGTLGLMYINDGSETI